MLFATEEGPIFPQGQAVYVQQDYALNFVPSSYSNCSVLIGYVELGFAWFYHDIKRANQVRGHCGSPTTWRQLQLCVPAFHRGRLLLLDETIEEGDNVRLKGSDTWDISYDPATSWVCFGEANILEDDIRCHICNELWDHSPGEPIESPWGKTYFFSNRRFCVTRKALEQLCFILFVGISCLGKGVDCTSHEFKSSSLPILTIIHLLSLLKISCFIRSLR